MNEVIQILILRVLLSPLKVSRIGNLVQKVLHELFVLTIPIYSISKDLYQNYFIKSGRLQ